MGNGQLLLRWPPRALEGDPSERLYLLDVGCEDCAKLFCGRRPRREWWDLSCCLFIDGCVEWVLVVLDYLWQSPTPRSLGV